MLSSFDLLEISKNLEKLIGSEIDKISLSMFDPTSQCDYELYLKCRYQIEGMRMATTLIKDALKEK